MARAASSRLSGRRPSAKLTYANKRAKQTRGRVNTGFSVQPLTSSSYLSPRSLGIIEFTFAREANKHCEKMDPSNSTSSSLSSALPSRLSEHCLSPQISGQCNEPAAPQAAEITVEEANSSLPGIHIVAALQWDGLRQISS